MRRLVIALSALIVCERPVIGQTLNCEIIKSLEGIGIGAATATAPIPVDKLEAGYRATGGGCYQRPAASGEHYGYLEQSVPTDHDYTCAVRVGDGEGARITAYVVACKLPVTRRDRTTAYSSAGLGGGFVVVARTANDAPNYATKIPYSIRLCNTVGGTDVAVFFANKNSVAKNVPFGECFETDQPTELFINTPNSVSIDVWGKYELYKPGTFTKTIVTNKRTTPPTEVKEANFVRLGKEDTETVICHKPGDPNQPTFPVPGQKLDPSFSAYCPATKLTGSKHYRVCFDAGFSHQLPDQSDNPGAMMPMLFDPALLAKPLGGSQDQFLLNSLAPGGCRDLFNVTQAYFAVTTATWNNQSVNSITFRFREILK